MYPELFHVGPIPIRSYGVMLAISFVVGVLYIWHIARRDKKPFDPYLTIASLMILSGVLGARLFYVLFHLEEFAGQWGDVVNPFHSDHFGIAGLNLYGGVISAVGVVLLYCRAARLNPLGVFDDFSPTLGIGLGLTRIGCFLNGCCFGTPTELPWGLTFPPDSIPYSIFQNLPLHPAQLYSSLYGLLLFVFLHFTMKRKRFTGQLVAILFMCEALFRYTIEYVRYYENEMMLRLDGETVTYNQIISAGLFIIGLTIFLVQRKRGAFLKSPLNDETPTHISE